MKFFWRIISVLIIVIYPFGVFFGLKFFEPRILSLLLLAVVAFHFLSGKSQYFRYQKYLMLFLVLVLVTIIQISNNILFIKIYPFLISMILLSAFLFSVFYPPSIIEKIARTYDKNLPKKAIKYTHRVTIIWCFFFVFNGSVSLYTAFFSSLEIWTLYNGFISYLLIGTLFVIEYICRQFIIKRDKNVV